MAVLDIYTRVSRKGDDRQLSTRGQEKHCRARVTEAGHEVGQVFTDDGKSAWRKDVKRPDWTELMRRLESDESGGVCVYDLSRFARQVKDGERLIDAAERGLIILDSEQAFDLTSPGGKKAFRDNINAAAYYSDLSSKKIPRGKQLRAADGQPNGSHRAFGFEQDGMTQRPAEAVVIQDWAERLLRGETQWSILQSANAAGLVTTYGQPWTRSGFRAVMGNERNAGWIMYRGERASRLPGEPILEPAVHAEVVALFASRKRGRPASERYLCSGLVRCGLCGHGLTGRPHHGKRQYWCNANNGGCGHLGIASTVLDEWAAEWAIKTLADPAHVDRIAEREAEYTARHKALEDEAASIETILDDMNAKLAADLPAALKAGRAERVRARHDAVAEPLEARLGELATLSRDLEAEMGQELPRRTLSARDASYIDWLDQWQSGTTGEQRKIVAQALGGRVLVIEPGGRGAERIAVKP